MFTLGSLGSRGGATLYRLFLHDMLLHGFGHECPPRMLAVLRGTIAPRRLHVHQAVLRGLLLITVLL